MALMCNCRGIGGKAITLYLKNRQGEFVPPKDVFNACQRGANTCCQERKSDCNEAIKDIVRAHNAAITPANDEQIDAPPPPQYGHN